MPCAVKSSLKTGLQISLLRSIIQSPTSLLTKTGFHPSNRRSFLSEFELDVKIFIGQQPSQGRSLSNKHRRLYMRLLKTLSFLDVHLFSPIFLRSGEAAALNLWLPIALNQT